MFLISAELDVVTVFQLVLIGTVFCCFFCHYLPKHCFEHHFHHCHFIGMMIHKSVSTTVHDDTENCGHTFRDHSAGILNTYITQSSLGCLLPCWQISTPGIHVETYVFSTFLSLSACTTSSLTIQSSGPIASSTLYFHSFSSFMVLSISSFNFLPHSFRLKHNFPSLPLIFLSPSAFLFSIFGHVTSLNIPFG